MNCLVNFEFYPPIHSSFSCFSEIQQHVRRLITDDTRATAEDAPAPDSLPAETLVVKEEKASVNSIGVVERLADRLCAVIHGYHLASFNRPFWETPRYLSNPLISLWVR